MKAIIITVAAAGLLLAGAALRGARESQDPDAQYRKLLWRDDAITARSEQLARSGSRWAAVKLRWQQWRMEVAYRRFLHDHPQHAAAMVAFGGFLYDMHRQQEAVAWWEKAIAVNPRAAHAYNNLANHYGHYGRAADALRYYQIAFELDPAEPMFRYNWATTCVLFRNEAKEVYGWDADEIFRRGLEQFRQARDLAPGEYSFSSAYAETFFMVENPNWQQAYDAWQFCLSQPLDDGQRHHVYANLARVCMRMARYDEAGTWLGKMNGEQFQGLRSKLQRKLTELRSNRPSS